MSASPRLILCAAGLLALGGAAGCAPFSAPAEDPAPAAPTPVPDDLGTVIAPAEMPISVPAPIVSPEPTSTISLTLQTAAFDPALDVWPGPWAPDGSALVAYVVTAEDEVGMSGPTGRLWTVDAGTALPLWDSGDIEDAFMWGGLAEWQPDGTLVLARADGMKVHADGSPAGDVEGIDGQVTRVDVSPDGQTTFAAGVSEGWLVGADNIARKVQNDAGANFADWTWRADSQSLALSECGGELFMLDVITATTRAIAAVPSGDHGGCMGAPRWLARNALVAGEPDTVVDIDTSTTRSMDEWLGNDTAGDAPLSRVASVSPDGRFVVVDAYWPLGEGPTPSGYPGPSSPVLRERTLRDLVAGTSRSMETTGRSPVWSPTSDRFAVATDDGSLVVYSAAEDAQHVIVGRGSVGAGSFEWSPDGRWLVFNRYGTELWLAASDGSTGPALVTYNVGYGAPPPVTWALDGHRFAVALPDAEAARVAEEATNTAAGPSATAVVAPLDDVSKNLVLVTIGGAGE